MKRSLLVLAGLLMTSGLVSAQVLENFNDGGFDGWTTSGRTTTGTTTLKIAASPMPSSKADSSLAVSISFPANNAGDISIPVYGGSADGTSGSRILDTWVYIPSSASMPDSLQIQAYGQDVPGYNFYSNNYYAVNIPKDKWYPIPLYITQDTITQTTKAFDASQRWVHGFQITMHGQDTAKAWSGTFYIDNVTANGQTPFVIDSFASQTEISNIKLSNSDNIDSIYATIATDDSGVTHTAMAVSVNLDTSVGGTGTWFSFNKPQTSQTPTEQYNYLALWIYIPKTDTIPSGVDFQLFGQPAIKTASGTNYPFNTISDNIQNQIPKGRWYPLYWALTDSSIADSAKWYMSGQAGNLNLFGIQVGNWGAPKTPWKGTFYVTNIELLGVPLVGPPPVWLAADFNTKKKTINGMDGFRIPSWAMGKLAPYTDLTNGGVYTLEGTMDLSSVMPFFATVRDSVPTADTSSRTATGVSVNVLLQSGTPSHGVVQLYLSGGVKDSASVVDTIGSQIMPGQWTTLMITGLDSLATKGDFVLTNPAHQLGVVVHYPAPYDTTNWSGTVEIDSVKVYGISFPWTLPDEVYTSVNTASNNLPKAYRLYNNYPNPFNPTTVIQYDLPNASNVSLKVYDVLGREVATLVDGKEAAGSYKVTFNADRFASGVYFVRMIAGNYVHVQKMMLLK